MDASTTRFPSVAFFGNNLDVGYRFVRSLSRRGARAKLFCTRYSSGQEQHGWWSGTPLDPALVHTVDADLALYRIGPLVRSAEIRELYARVREFDVLVMSEVGPALFSELHGMPKIFFSFGSDLQILPFLVRVKGDLRGRLRRSLAGLDDCRAQWMELLGLLRQQGRQRKGIRQSSRLVCSTHQLPLTRRLGVPRERVELSLNIPMDAEVLAEVSAEAREGMRARYGALDLVFLHPTRHFYLPLDADVFLKDNDKLLQGFAAFAAETPLRVRLLLVRKGRGPDLAQSERQVERLGIADRVEWLPEMSNRDLRALYAQDNVVVCDQFNPNIAMLGSIGREATYYGRPLVTAFGEHNSAAYANDWPPHIFAADTAEAVRRQLHAVSALGPAGRQSLAASAREWFSRNLDERALMPRYMELIRKVAEERP